MNDAVLLMQCWPDNPYVAMMKLNEKRNQDYCERHNIDLEILVGIMSEKYGDYRVGSWVKVEQIIAALNKGYRYVIFLEPDTLIKDMSADLRDGCPNGVGACFHRAFGLHWNTGAIYMQNTDDTRRFMDEWLAAFPGDNRQWRELHVFNQLGRVNPVVQTISDRWNATINCSMVPDAVVVGFHGVGMTASQRLQAMEQALASFTLKETGQPRAKAGGD